jgi:uncharacterized protein YqfA (UPF0365 family)
MTNDQLARLDVAIAELQALREAIAPKPAPMPAETAIAAPGTPPMELRPDPRVWLRQNYHRIVCGKTHDAAIRRVQSYLRITRAHAEKLVAEMR